MCGVTEHGKATFKFQVPNAGINKKNDPSATGALQALSSDSTSAYVVGRVDKPHCRLQTTPRLTLPLAAPFLQSLLKEY
jgi:hypothetical protein